MAKGKKSRKGKRAAKRSAGKRKDPRRVAAGRKAARTRASKKAARRAASRKGARKRKRARASETPKRRRKSTRRRARRASHASETPKKGRKKGRKSARRRSRGRRASGAPRVNVTVNARAGESPRRSKRKSTKGRHYVKKHRRKGGTVKKHRRKGGMVRAHLSRENPMHEHEYMLMENPLSGMELFVGFVVATLGAATAEITDRLIAGNSLTDTGQKDASGNAIFKENVPDGGVSNTRTPSSRMGIVRWLVGIGITGVPIGIGMIPAIPPAGRSALQLFGVGAGVRTFTKGAIDGASYLLRNTSFGLRTFDAEIYTASLLDPKTRAAAIATAPGTVVAGLGGVPSLGLGCGGCGHCKMCRQRAVQAQGGGAVAQGGGGGGGAVDQGGGGGPPPPPPPPPGTVVHQAPPVVGAAAPPPPPPAPPPYPTTGVGAPPEENKHTYGLYTPRAA
jgi:hypothetical protein